MIIVGEKINTAIKSVKEAVDARDRDFIANLATSQAEAGAHYIDVCASAEHNRELDVLKWMVDIVRDYVDLPLCVDSPNPETIVEIVKAVSSVGMINSASAEGNKSRILFPLAAEFGWEVVLLAIDNNGIPAESSVSVKIASAMIKEANEHGIPNDRIYVDPVVTALPTDNMAMIKFIEVMKSVKQKHPGVKAISGLSNISFGMPRRRLVNRNFLTVTMYEGMDAAILDPLDKDIMGNMLAVKALLGKDRHCMQYNKAYRKGLL